MSRYIDADEVKRNLFSYYSFVNLATSKENYSGETLTNYEVAEMIAACITNTATADVQEVRHGKWIDQMCSECGRDAVYKIVYGRWEYENFCPHCGAKMNDGIE